MNLNLIFLFISVFTSSAFACDCELLRGTKLAIIGKVAGENECKSRILESLYHEFKNSTDCSEPLKIEWACGDKRVEKEFECSAFETMRDAEAVFIAASLSNAVLTESAIIDSEQPYSCGDFEEPAKSEENKVFPNKAAFSVESEQELYEVLSAAKPDLPGRYLDEVENYAVQLSFINDNNSALNKLTGSRSNDIANTHATHFLIQKKLDGKGYMVEASWFSNLYTSYTNPRDPDYWRDEENITNVSQYFIEENLAKVLMKKVKEGDEVYWSAGGGIHELNKDDAERSVLFSSLAQQKPFHELIIDVQQKSSSDKRIITKRYHNVPQDGSELSLFVEGNVGKRFTIGPVSSKRVRTYVELDAGARLSGVQDASYVGLEGSLNADVRVWRNTAARFSGGARTAVYIDGSQTKDKFVDVSVGTKVVKVGYQFGQNSDRLAGYQNPLPESYTGRDQDAPKRNDVHMFYLRVAW